MTSLTHDALAKAYEAFNRRETDRLLEMVSEDVDWPAGDRRIHGREALREHFESQWTRTRTTDTPTRYADEADGRILVSLHQIVRDLDGKELSRGSFDYFYTMRGDLIARLDIGQ